MTSNKQGPGWFMPDGMLITCVLGGRECPTHIFKQGCVGSHLSHQLPTSMSLISPLRGSVAYLASPTFVFRAATPLHRLPATPFMQPRYTRFSLYYPSPFCKSF